MGGVRGAAATLTAFFFNNLALFARPEGTRATRLFDDFFTGDMPETLPLPKFPVKPLI
jgi:hypothetical protein